MSTSTVTASPGDIIILPDGKRAGWRYAWQEARYYWAMTAPDGTSITYIEGDIYLGNTRRTP